MPYYSRYNAPYGALLRYGYRNIHRLYYARCGAFCCVVRCRLGVVYWQGRGARSIGLFFAFWRYCQGRKMLLTANAGRLDAIPPEGERAPPPRREGVRRVAENFKKNKKDYKLSFSY